MSHEVLSTCVYLLALGFMDLIVLYVHCGNTWLTSLTGFDLNLVLMNYSEVICKAYPFALDFVRQMARWLIAATATDGMIAAGCLDR